MNHLLRLIYIMELEKKKDVTTIRRELVRSSRGVSKWKIDGKSANEGNVKDLVEKEMNIQIGNLCTFLPQEKVGEFSAFDDVGLLRETEKAIGGESLYNQHEELIKAEQSLNNAERKKHGIEEEVEKLREKKAQLEPDKQRLEKRQEHLKTIDLCITRKNWLEFEELRAQAREDRERAKEAQDEFTEQKAKIEPLQAKLNDARSSLSLFKTRFDKVVNKQVHSQEKSDKAFEDLEAAKAQVEEVLDSIQNLGSRRKKLEEKAAISQAKYDKKLKEMNDYLKKAPTMAQTRKESIDQLIAYFKQQIQEKRQPYNDATNTERDADQAFRSAKLALKEPQADLERLRNERDALTNTEELRLQEMARTEAGNQCRLMREWINKNKGAFIQTVYGPCRLVVNVQQSHHRALVEAHVANWIWHSFVCQTKRDYDTCIEYAQKCGEQFRMVNFLLASNDSTPQSSSSQLWSKEYIESKLYPLGVQGILSDLVTCPPPVLKALNDHAGLNSALFGENNLQMNLDRASDDQTIANLLLPRGVDRYVAFILKHQQQRGKRAANIEIIRYQAIRSRYARGDISTLIGQAYQKNVLGEPSDETKINELTMSITQAEQIIQDLSDKFQAANQQKVAAKKLVEKTKKDFETSNETIKKLTTAKSEVASAKRMAETKKRELADADKEEERDRKKYQKQLEAKIQAAIRAAQSAASFSHQVYSDTAKATAPFIAKSFCKQHVDRLQRSVENAKKALNEYERKKDELAQAFRKCKEKALVARKIAEEQSPCTPLEDYEEQLNNLPTSVEAVDQILETEQEAAKIIQDNPQLLEQYNDLMQKLQRAEKQYEDLEADAETRQANLDKIRAPWESTLRNALIALREKFSFYMSRLNARGDVEIAAAPTYDKWGLVIKVAFRDGAPMSKLEAHVQSGGERSISTIMFLMALQAHMPSPFRVVDEINQGMDETNERIMFKRIVLNSTGPTAPQYFLITPKLLQNLEGLDHPDVRALIVFNGAYNLDNQFPITSFLDKKRKLENMSEDDHNAMTDD
mmetsp:Transcript_21152/g.32442  ORF Transcript_21152/g.32442 Transcript_21152/m.32442 type:complete len:1033 (-) Transcript_21152:441-3539(-)